MLKVEHIDVWGFEHAIRGMRNPLNSWFKSDSLAYCDDGSLLFNSGGIGNNDMKLMQKLYKAGPSHRKYLRQIFVSMDITAPLYWWKEFDTYKVGTVANSCSTMHKIHSKEFTIDDFSHEHLLETKDQNFAAITIDGEPALYSSTGMLYMLIDVLNYYRSKFLETKDKVYWWQLIQLLPSSYNQKRTVTMSYENVMAIIKQRRGHKLDEWHDFIDILSDLPYVREISED